MVVAVKMMIDFLWFCITVGKTMAEVEEESIGRPNPYNLCCVSLHPSSRVDLWKSLDLRCEKMIETGNLWDFSCSFFLLNFLVFLFTGLLREVKELLEFDRKGTMVSLGSAIGYRETIEFLDWVEFVPPFFCFWMLIFTHLPP